MEEQGEHGHLLRSRHREVQQRRTSLKPGPPIMRARRIVLVPERENRKTWVPVEGLPLRARLLLRGERRCRLAPHEHEFSVVLKEEKPRVT
jgi:hypothetical protein